MSEPQEPAEPIVGRDHDHVDQALQEDGSLDVSRAFWTTGLKVEPIALGTPDGEMVVFRLSMVNEKGEQFDALLEPATAGLAYAQIDVVAHVIPDVDHEAFHDAERTVLAAMYGDEGHEHHAHEISLN